MFEQIRRVHLKETDAAGIVFFASYYTMAHDAYELALEKHGFLLSDLIKSFLFPIVHSQANYFHPLLLSQRIKITTSCSKISQRSFELTYRFYAISEDLDLPQEINLCTELKTVHVSVKDGKATALPLEILSFLEKLSTNAT